MSEKKGISELITIAGDDPDFAAQFAKAATADEVVAIAAELGFDVTAEEVQAAAAEMSTREVSETELASLAGGGLGASINACDGGAQLVTRSTMYGAGC